MNGADYRRSARLLALFAVLLTGTTSTAGDHRDHSLQSRLTVQHHSKTQTTEILIEANNGKVTVADILSGLARAKGFDESAFADLVPPHSFNLYLYSASYAVTAWNRTLPDGVKVKIVLGERWEDEPSLSITLDRAALMASRRRFQKILRDSAVNTATVLNCSWRKRYDLNLDPGWQKMPLDKPLVVLVPGYQAKLDSLGILAKILRRQGFVVGSFSYPNDQPIKESAEAFADKLKEIASQQPQRKLRLVAHSMGALVARYAIENAGLNPGNVEQLIMIAPPSHGSRLACFGFALELWEHAGPSAECHAVKSFYAAIEDGLGEADEDLQPDSVFLLQLNKLPRNPKVHYAILMGTAGPLSKGSLQPLRRYFRTVAKHNRFVRFYGPKLDELLADLDEVIHSKGDGVVAVSRAKLAGVNDILLLPVDHLALNRAPITAAEQRLFQEIVNRLKVLLP